MWLMGSVVLQYVSSPWTRDRTGVPCIARQILNHWSTREAPVVVVFNGDLSGILSGLDYKLPMGGNLSY